MAVFAVHGWLGEVEECAAGALGAVPGQCGGDDGVIVSAGGGAVAPGAAGQALQGVIGQFAQQDGVVQQADVVALDGQGQGFDEGGFGFAGGEEGAHGQAFPGQGFDIGFADAVGFGPDDLRLPALNERFEPVALEVPADPAEAVERGHFAGGGIDDGDGGVVFAASPVDAGDVGMAGLGPVEAFGGDGIADAAEDLSAVVGEVGQVFAVPDVFRREGFDLGEFGGIDEGVVGGGKVEGLPVAPLGVLAELVQVVEPVASVGGAQEEGAAAGGGEHGSDDLDPELRVHEGGFIEDDEIESFAAQVVGVPGAVDGDHAAAGQVNAAFAFADLLPFQWFGSALQVAPDLGGHFAGGRQPPAAFVLPDCGYEDAGDAEFGFAPAASAGDDFEASRVVHDLRLSRVGVFELDRGSGIGI